MNGGQYSLGASSLAASAAKLTATAVAATRSEEREGGGRVRKLVKATNPESRIDTYFFSNIENTRNETYCNTHNEAFLLRVNAR
jgi:hypothetical protein